VAVKSSGDISAELVRGQKIEEHVVRNLDVRNDDNVPSSTSGAAEERQEVSSKNTIDELFDAFTGGKDIGLWSFNITEKLREYWLKNEKLFFEDMMFHNTVKTGTRHGNAPQTFFGARTTTPKSLNKADFVFLHTLVFIVSRVD